MFLEAYPDQENLVPNMVTLRYIDSIEFDYENDILRFLQEKMEIGIDINQDLFGETGVTKTPFDIELKFSFHSALPKGAMDIRMKRGKRAESDALIWETMFRSLGADVPKSEEEIITWVDSAHSLTDDWFFKLIEGDLLKEFE